MLALSLSIGLTGAVFYYLRQNQNVFIVEASIADLHQNFRASMDLITRDIQSAGSGAPRFLGPISMQDGGTDASGNPLPDEIFILYGDPTFTDVPVINSTTGTPLTSRTSAIQVQTPPVGAPAFTNGQNYILYAVAQANEIGTADLAEFDVFTLNSQSNIAGGIQLSAAATSAVNPPSWATVFPSAAALRVTRLSEWVRYRVDTTTNELQRSVNGGAFVAVAHDIANMQLQYWIEHVDPVTGAVTPSLVDQVGTTTTNNRALIRNVVLTLTGRTQMSRNTDGQGQRSISQTIQITPRNLVLPGFVRNR